MIKEYITFEIEKISRISAYQSVISKPPLYPMYVMRVSDFVHLSEVRMSHREDLMQRGLLREVIEDASFKGKFQVKKVNFVGNGI